MISPVLAGGLAQKYAVDALELKTRLRAEESMSHARRAGDDINRLAGLVGSSGSEFLRVVAARLERARRRGVRWRTNAVLVLSLALVAFGAFLDKFLNQIFGDLLWLSLVTAAVFWTYDRVFSTFVQRQTRKWRLQVIMDAIDKVADWLVFLREQQAELNMLRWSVGKTPVQLVDIQP